MIVVIVVCNRGSSFVNVGLLVSTSSIFLIPILHTRCCFPERVKILLKKKADSTIANKKKELPLHRACASSDNIEVGVTHQIPHSSHQRNPLVSDVVC